MCVYVCVCVCACVCVCIGGGERVGGEGCQQGRIQEKQCIIMGFVDTTIEQGLEVLIR